MKPFDEVVTEYGPTVLRVCRALLGADDAEEAWSETFLAALRAYPDLASDSNIEAWLVTIAHRKAIDQHRGRARRPVPTDDPGDWPASSPALEPQVETGGGELCDALRALPAKQRQTIAYHHIAGLTYVEITEIIGGSVAAARRAAADGIKTLRATYTRGVSR